MGGFYLLILAYLSLTMNTNAQNKRSVNLAKERSYLAKEAKECTNKPDGFYAIADSFSYVQCTDGVASYNKCDMHKIFVPSCWECLVHLPSQLPFFCEGRIAESPLGKKIKFQHPWDCRTWIVCADGSPEQHACTGDKIFDAKRQQCVQSAESCTLGPVASLYTNRPFLPSELPKQVNAAFLWSDGNVVLMDGSTYSMYDEQDGRLMPGFPLTIEDHKASGIPDHVDAALSLPDKRIFFFKGKEFWLWGSNDHPKQISDEWPSIPDDLDSAFYWTHTKKAYFFKEAQFYRYDMEKRAVDPGYPRKISRSWPGAVPRIDAAVGLKNGTIFLFKGRKHFTFNPPFCRPENPVDLYQNVAKFQLVSDA